MFRQTCMTFKMKYEKEMALLFSGNDERVNVKGQNKTWHKLFINVYLFKEIENIF